MLIVHIITDTWAFFVKVKPIESVNQIIISAIVSFVKMLSLTIADGIGFQQYSNFCRTLHIKPTYSILGS